MKKFRLSLASESLEVSNFAFSRADRLTLELSKAALLQLLDRYETTIMRPTRFPIRHKKRGQVGGLDELRQLIWYSTKYRL